MLRIYFTRAFETNYKRFAKPPVASIVRVFFRRFDIAVDKITNPYEYRQLRRLKNVEGARTRPEKCDLIRPLPQAFLKDSRVSTDNVLYPYPSGINLLFNFVVSSPVLRFKYASLSFYKYVKSYIFVRKCFVCMGVNINTRRSEMLKNKFSNKRRNDEAK